jgi:hypothetical protein
MSSLSNKLERRDGPDKNIVIAMDLNAKKLLESITGAGGIVSWTKMIERVHC